ncbi:MAG: hypothetical protein DMF87_02015 [Acidobacteria bacterium]|nr:MAG: hypothetical protein DMF87_02015 [Acidobacteriota bacterium]
MSVDATEGLSVDVSANLPGHVELTDRGRARNLRIHGSSGRGVHDGVAQTQVRLPEGPTFLRGVDIAIVPTGTR